MTVRVREVVLPFAVTFTVTRHVPLESVLSVVPRTEHTLECLLNRVMVSRAPFGLGRFYVLYLVYNHVRDGFNAGRAMKDVVSDDSLIRADDSAAFIDAFDVSEVNRLANEAVLALQWVLDQNPSIDGVRALLRQGAHRAAILARFESQV
ncbi:MAG: hypothetical protein RL219_291 [Actinomycetota bacterium]